MSKLAAILNGCLTAALLLAGPQLRAAKPGPSATHAPKLPQPPKVERVEIREAIARGRQFLLKNRNQDGSLGSARHTKGLNIYAPAPGSHRAFRAAVTAMAFQALLITADDPNHDDLVGLRQWLLEHLPDVKRTSPDTIYNIWAHAYGIQALTAALRNQQLERSTQKAVKKQIQLQIERLQAYETVHGGWAYYNFGPLTRTPSSYSNSFVNAAVLVALHDAAEQGMEAPTKVRKRAIRALQRQRKPDCSYLYSQDWQYLPMNRVNQPGGSLGRSQAGNLALALWGDQAMTPAIQQAWLNRLIARHGWLDLGRKRPVPHESWYAVAGYYYYFGLYYASRTLRHLPKAARPIYTQHLARLILDRQEKNGSWWDYPLYNYHPFYGTAFALQSLHHCVPAQNETASD